MTKLKCLLLLACAFAFTEQAAGAPAITSITGTHVDGDTLTITGTDFGTNDLWFTFLGGPNGVTDNDSLRTIMAHIDDLHAIGHQGWQTAPNGRSSTPCLTDTFYIPRLKANGQVRPNRKSSITTETDASPKCYGNQWGFYPWDKVTAVGAPQVRHTPWWDPDSMRAQTLYASWWEYDDARTFVFDPGQPNYQGGAFKHIRLASGTLSHPYGFYYPYQGGFWLDANYNRTSNDVPYYAIVGMESRCGCQGCGAVVCPSPTYWYVNTGRCCGSGQGGDQYCSTKPRPTSPGSYQARGRWVRNEVYVVANLDSSQGATDDYSGTVYWRFQAPGKSLIYVHSREASPCLLTTHPWEWRAAALSTGCGGGTPDIKRVWNAFAEFTFMEFQQQITDRTTYRDDIFVQANSQARVLVSDASTYATSTHFEIQQPTAWDSTEVKVVFNQGSFDTNKCLYVYLIDDDAVVSNGVKIWDGCTPCCPDSCKPDCTAACIDAAQ